MATKEAAGRPVFATPPTTQQLHELALRVSFPADYVDRRTTTISYPGTEDVIRRVMLDTSVPSGDLPEVGSVGQETLVAFPIGFAQRGSSLTGFSLTVNEEAASLLTRIENEELTRGVILALMPESVNLAQPVVDAAEALVGADDAVTARDAAAQLLFEAAQAHPEHPEGEEFLAAVLDADDQGVPQRGLRTLLARLLTNYVMYVRVPNGAGRVLIAREVDHQHPEEAPEDLDEWWSRQAERWLLKWPEAAIDPEAADARSTHLEANFPRDSPRSSRLAMVTCSVPRRSCRCTRGRNHNPLAYRERRRVEAFTSRRTADSRSPRRPKPAFVSDLRLAAGSCSPRC